MPSAGQYFMNAFIQVPVDHVVCRRVQDNFRLFSAAARGSLLPMRKGTGWFSWFSKLLL